MGVGGDQERAGEPPKVPGKWSGAGTCQWSQKPTWYFSLPNVPDEDRKEQDAGCQGESSVKFCVPLRPFEEEMNDINTKNDKEIGTSNGQSIMAIFKSKKLKKKAKWPLKISCYCRKHSFSFIHSTIY